MVASIEDGRLYVLDRGIGCHRMYRFETIDLDEYREDDYFLTGFVEPEPADEAAYTPDEDATEYGVSLARAPTYPYEETIEIVRMDTSHGQPHIDHLYLPEDTTQQRKEWLSSGYSYSRMKQYLLTSWKGFVDRYIKHNE